MQSPVNIQSKFPKIGTTIFTVMSQMAAEHGALNLAQGFPDFSPQPEIVRWVNYYMEQGKNQYAPMAGLLSLREGIAKKMEQLYSANYNPDTEITIVPGATVGVYAAISAVVKENDEVLVFEPCYDSYVPAIEANGGKAIFAELKLPDFKPNWEEVKKLLSPKTKMIILNSPHNPTGATLNAQDMVKLDKIIKDRDIVLLSDEVYEHIIFDKMEHQSIARFPNLACRSFIVYSFGKTYHCTGWKMGYVLAPAQLMSEFRKIYQYIAFSAHTPSQYAFAEALKNPEWHLSLNDFYQERRDVFCDALKGSKFKIKPSRGTYFQLLNYAKISEMNDMEFATYLTQEKKLAAIPVSSFYRKKVDIKLLRFCFAKEKDVLLRAVEILQSL
jgi:methionine aminotransferase